MAHGPNVPPEVLTAVKTMLAGRRQGLEAFDFAGARNEVGAVEAWLGPSFPFPGRRHNLALHRTERQTAPQGGR